MLSKPSVLVSEHAPASIGSSRIAVRAELLVFAELKIEKILGNRQPPGAPPYPLMPSPTVLKSPCEWGTKFDD
jgi:hypothetical protein